MLHVLCIVSLLLTYARCGLAADVKCAVKVNELSELTPIQMKEKSSSDIDLFAHLAVVYHPLRAFTDVFLVTNLSNPDDYRLYQGANCSDVLNEYHQDNRLFGLLKTVSSWRSHHLYPFNETVVGIDTAMPYTVSIKTWKVNYIRAGVFGGAVLLFLFANGLVRNTVFYYSSGCSFGLFASLLLVAFIVYRVAPKKTIGIPILLGGWSVSLYMLHFAWNNLSAILLNYQKYVAAYFLTVLLISFFVCYKRGPPTDARLHDIVQWTLQLLALTLIYGSSQIPEVSLAVMAILVVHQITKSWLWYLVARVLGVFGWIWRKVFPPRPRFLSEVEYEQQMQETTEKELLKLRSFCRSPDADMWKITRSVRNPRKFASFIDGNEDHISEDEELIHEMQSEYMERCSEEVEIDGLDDDVIAMDEEEEDDVEYDEDIIIKRTPRVGSSTSLSRASSTHSIRVPRGVSARALVERLTASTGLRGPPISRLPPQPKRATQHSLAGNLTMLRSTKDLPPLRTSSRLVRVRFDNDTRREHVLQSLGKHRLLREEVSILVRTRRMVLTNS